MNNFPVPVLAEPRLLLPKASKMSGEAREGTRVAPQVATLAAGKQFEP